MKKLFLKLFLASFLLLAVIALYAWFDPFKVLYHYDDYRAEEEKTHVSINRDYTNTELFLKNYGSYQYDSYIFGSSRSKFYFTADWQKHINAHACFHYDASDESLFGINGKMELLHKRGVKIKNALLIMDYELLGVTKNQDGPVYRKHPLVSGESRLDFQMSMFTYFLDVNFITAYLRFVVTHKITQSMLNNGLIPSKAKTQYNAVTNEITETGTDELIANYPDSFYRSRAHVFYKRDTVLHFADHVIGQAQIKMLNNIKNILDADSANYKIVISPLYNQNKMDTTDIALLRTIFGNERVYDFSGINDITNDMHNYYETSHYRPFVCAQIMNVIYAKN